MNSARSSRPAAASLSTPPDSRSMTHTTGAEHRAARAELDRGVEDRAAGGDHVFDDAEPRAVDVAALGELAGAVRLRLLAHETGRAARSPATASSRAGPHRVRDPASASASAGTSGARAIAMSLSSAGSASKRYLSKYSRARHARAQGEGPGEVRRGVDPRGERSEIGAAAIAEHRTVDRHERGGLPSCLRRRGNTAPARRWLGMTGPGGPVIPPRVHGRICPSEGRLRRVGRRSSSGARLRLRAVLTTRHQCATSLALGEVLHGRDLGGGHVGVEVFSSAASAIRASSCGPR